MKTIITFSFLVLITTCLFSANKTFTGPGSFSVAAKWSGGTLPVAGDNLFINGTCTFDNAALNLVYGSLTVGSTVAGSLNWPAAGTNTLNVTAISSSKAGSAIDMTGGGVLQIRTSWTTTNLNFNAGAGTVNWNVTGANSSLPTTITTYKNLITTTGSFIVTLGAATTTVSSNMTVASGTFAIGSLNFTCNGMLYISGTLNDNSMSGSNTINNMVLNSGGTIDNSVNETYSIAGNFTMLGGNITGSAKPTYDITGNLLISSGTNNMGSAQINVTGTTSVSATLNCNNTSGKKTLNDFIVTSSGNFNCTVAEKWAINGNIKIDGVATPGSGVYTLGGTSKTISGSAAVTFANLTCNGTYTNNAIVTVTAMLKGAGTWTQGSTGVLNLSITDINFIVATFNASAMGNTVNYALAGLQNVRIPADGSYSNLFTSGTGIKTLLANTLASGSVSITTSSLDVSASNFSLTVGGNWSDAGSFVGRAGTVIFSGTSAQTIFKSGGETFNNITFSNAGTKTLLSAITASTCLINSGSTLDVNTTNNQISLTGNFTNNGTFTSQNGTVLLNGILAQGIYGSSVTSFYNLTLNNLLGASLNKDANLINTLTLTNGTFNTNGKVFTMISTASNTARIAPITGTGDILGNVTIQRYAPGGTTGWALLGAPITSALTYQAWDDNIPISCASCPDGSAGGFISIYTYDETAVGSYSDAAAYVPMTGITDPIALNKGYWVYLGTGYVSTTPIVLDVTGTVGKFNNTISLTRTNTGVAADDGWNLISNPYPSPIKWSLLKGATANIDNAIYAYNADLNGGTGGTASYVNGISSPAVGAGGIGDTIPMCQGFYVHSTGATALSGSESIKVGGNPTFLKTSNTSAITSSPIPLFRLFLDNTYGHHDETVVYLQAGATNQFDALYDAVKLVGQDPYAPNMRLMDGINELQINGISTSLSSFSMPLKTTTGYNDNYTISLADFSSFPMGSCITLYDSYTNSTTDLRTSNYVFALTDTTTASRFTLNITMSPLNITSGLVQPTCSTPNIASISAKGVSAGPWNYYWKDANGVIIKTSLNRSTADTITNLFGGNYNLEVNTVGLCDHNDSQFSINPIDIPVAQFNSIDTAYISNGAVSFTNTSVNAQSNTWDFGDMIGTSTSFDPTYNFTTVGTYTVSLITQSSTGCLDTTQKSIVVILENTAGIKDLQNAMGLLLKTLENNMFMLNGTYTESEKVQISVRDVQGKNVYDFGFVNSKNIQLPVDLSSVNTGIYYLEVTGNKTKVVYKLPVK